MLNLVPEKGSCRKRKFFSSTEVRCRVGNNKYIQLKNGFVKVYFYSSVKTNSQYSKEQSLPDIGVTMHNEEGALYKRCIVEFFIIFIFADNEIDWKICCEN